MTLPGHNDAINERPGYQDPGPELGTAAGGAVLKAAAEAAKPWLAARGLDRLGRPLEAEQEVWRSVDGYEGLYEVSNGGLVLDVRRRVLRALVKHTDGYLTVRLTKDGRETRHLVHRLVALAFHGDKRNKLHREVAHLDGDPANCRANNLKWVSPAENAFHKRAHGRHQAGERHPRVKLTNEIVASIRASSEQHAQLAARYDVNESAIRKIRRGQRWRQGFPKQIAEALIITFIILWPIWI